MPKGAFTLHIGGATGSVNGLSVHRRFPNHQCQQPSLYASRHESLLQTEKKHLNLRDTLDKSKDRSRSKTYMKFETDFIILC